MLKSLFIWILTNVFKIKTETTETEVSINEEFAEQYQQINEINFNAIFSNKLSNYVANDSTIELIGNNPRSELLNKTAQSMWRKLNKITSMVFGFGGILLIPYVKGGKIFYNIVPQTRLTIDEITGDLITGATILADKKIISSTISESIYLRWTNYKIQNNNLIITQQYTNQNGSIIPVPEFWADIQQVLSISNVDRVPFGYIKSPINNRRTNDKYGVSITYGCDSIIEEIRECLRQIVKEYDAKQVLIVMDKTAIGKDGKLPKSGLFTPVDIGVDDFWEIFDPAIRDSSYFNRLQELFARLEKAIGTSRGILTDPLSTYQNTDETKRALYDTLSIISAMRENIEQGLNDFFYSCNILANAYNLTPVGEYEVKYDWDFGLIESSLETWQQLVAGYEKGVVQKEELRQFIYPSEDIEVTKKIIKELEEKNPSIQQILGTDKMGINENEIVNKEEEE